MKYTNPVLPGFYPDPSICRVGSKFYMVCSSFQFFPGVPLFESEDLINWKQIGHVLTRESQLPLSDCDACGGIYAPTIRYNDGVFYMVTTNVTHGGNFYVTTRDIYGEWSDPIYVEQDGIDPSLYFEDGTAYFMSNGTDDEGIGGVTQCQIDIATGKKLSPARCIWQGTGGRYLESPHLYRIGNYYYLMAAEGGTEYGHMVVYARGNTPYGPFESYARNPVLTNRNLGGHQIQGCGHGDLVQDMGGNWWMVHLAFRQLHRWIMHHTTGREVYLVPVTFDEEGWFTAGVNGTTPAQIETDRLPDIPQTRVTRYTFQNAQLGRELVFMRNPIPENYRMEDGTLYITPSEDTLSQRYGRQSFVGLRQQQMELTLSAELTLGSGEAGLTLYMMHDQHYDLALRRTETGVELLRRLCIGDAVDEKVFPAPEDKAVLTITAEPQHYHFRIRCGGREFDLGSAQSRFLSTEIAGNFTGVVMGMYAHGQGAAPSAFRNFICQM